MSKTPENWTGVGRLFSARRGDLAAPVRVAGRRNTPGRSPRSASPTRRQSIRPS